VPGGGVAACKIFNITCVLLYWQHRFCPYQGLVMKKTVSTTFGFIFFIAQSWAQTDYGFKAGLSLSKLGSYQYSSHDHSKTGFNGGLFAKINLSPSFFVQPEITYSAKGFKFSWPELDQRGDLNLNYISVPVLAGIKLNNKLNILAGPEFSYLINATSDYYGKWNVTDLHDRFDLAADFGIGYNINKRLGAELRYSYGFDLVNGPAIGLPTTEFGIIDGSNKVLQFGLFYNFSKR
jgi:hypothetical protein